jgi:hypothetical protein
LQTTYAGNNPVKVITSRQKEEKNTKNMKVLGKGYGVRIPFPIPMTFTINGDKHCNPISPVLLPFPPLSEK